MIRKRIFAGLALLALLLFLALAAPAGAASPYTSARNGLWDASDVDTWGQGLGVYPQTAADVVNIGHTVTYNVVSTVELGAITINNGGILTFSTSMSTKLTLGHQEILVNNGGELRIGANGAVIPAAYTASVVWNTTSDNAKGINLAAGGKLNIYGDPAYYGSKFDYVLASQAVIPAATNAVTITIVGNYAANFAAGQELLIHKGGAYASYINDFARLAVVSAANNGANTDISCTVTERPGASLTCIVGADVLNVSRNVLFYKLNYNANLGQLNTNRPRLTNANTAGLLNYNVNDVSFGGFYSLLDMGTLIANKIVNRNGYSYLYISGGYTNYNSLIDNVILFSCYKGIDSLKNGTVSNSYICANQYGGIFNGSFRTFYNYLKIYGIGSLCAYQAVGTFQNCYFYSSAKYAGAGGHASMIFKDCVFDYNSAGIAMTSPQHFTLSENTNPLFINCKTPSPIVSTYRNDVFAGRLRFEHYQQVPNAHYIYDCFGDLLKVPADGSGSLPSQRSGGSQYVEQVTPQSNCNSTNYLEIFKVRVWATAGVSKTYKFYIQNNFGKTLTDSMLKLYGEYLDNNPAGTGHLAIADSTGQSVTNRANQADWSQYLSVTINPGVDGWVNLYLRLMDGTNASLWVDPMVTVE